MLSDLEIVVQMLKKTVKERFEREVHRQKLNGQLKTGTKAEITQQLMDLAGNLAKNIAAESESAIREGWALSFMVQIIDASLAEVKRKSVWPFDEPVDQALDVRTWEELPPVVHHRKKG